MVCEPFGRSKYIRSGADRAVGGIVRRKHRLAERYLSICSFIVNQILDRRSVAVANVAVRIHINCVK